MLVAQSCGMLMAQPWDAHGVLMAQPWSARDTQLWGARRTLVAQSCGMLVGRSWHSHGALLTLSSHPRLIPCPHPKTATECSPSSLPSPRRAS